MGLFGFGKKNTEEDLQNAIHSLDSLYRQAMGVDMTTKSRGQLKQELEVQLHHVLDICRKGKFSGMETVLWCGKYTPLRDVTPMVQVFIELM